MPTRLDRLNKYYWNISDISIVLGIPYKKASEVFKQIDEVEKKKPYRPHDTKVSVKSVLKLTETDERLLRRQILSELENKKNS